MEQKTGSIFEKISPIKRLADEKSGCEDRVTDYQKMKQRKNWLSALGNRMNVREQPVSERGPLANKGPDRTRARKFSEVKRKGGRAKTSDLSKRDYTCDGLRDPRIQRAIQDG